MRILLKIVQNNEADKSLRFFNLVIDRLTLMVIIFIAHFILGIIYELTNSELLYSYFYALENLTRLEDILYTSFLFIIYYFIMELSTNGRTIGKYITGTKTISIDGNKPTTIQLIYRSLSRIVPFDPISFFGETGWHDSWSETRVVKLKKYQEELRAKSQINEIGKES